MTSLSPANAERLKLAFQQCRDMEGTLERTTGGLCRGRTGDLSGLWRGGRSSGGADSRKWRWRKRAAARAIRCRPSSCPMRPAGWSNLNSLLEKGPVAVMFYRGHWCPYCRLNVRAVIQALDRIKALGGQVVAIMPEVQEFAEKFKSDADAPFPVLTDLDNGYALSLNLAIWLGTEIQRTVVLSGHAEAFTAMTAGCCRSPRPSWSAATAW